MRNYDSQPDLRPPDYDEDTPELQWLEDSINYLVAATFAVICLFCKLGFLLLRGVFSSFVKTKV
jgi:hypothetical protein